MEWLKKNKWAAYLIAGLLALVSLSTGTFINDDDTYIYDLGNGTYVEGEKAAPGASIIFPSATDRIFILTACGSTGNSVNPPVSTYEDVDAASWTECAMQMQAGDVIGWKIWLPPDYGTGGTFTFTMKVVWFTTTATEGTVTYKVRAADTKIGLQSATVVTLTADTWTVDEEDHITEVSTAVTIYGTPAANEPCYIELELDAETLDQDPFTSAGIVTFRGR